MPADDCLWAENCNRAEDGREPTIEPNEQRSVLLSCGRFDTCRRSTLSCWRRTRISATSFVLGLKNEAMIWRISRRNSIIKCQGYRVSASRLAESNFRNTQGKDACARCAIRGFWVDGGWKRSTFYCRRDRALPPDKVGAPHGLSFFTCPATHEQAPTGIETDAQSLQAAWKATLKINCPYCGEMHQISVRET